MLMKGRWSINYLILLIDGTLKRNERMKWFCANTAEKCQNVEICSIINWLCNYREGERERERKGLKQLKQIVMETISHVSHLVNLWIIYFTSLYLYCCQFIFLQCTSNASQIEDEEEKYRKRVGHDRFIMQIAVQFERTLCIFEAIWYRKALLELANWRHIVVGNMRPIIFTHIACLSNGFVINLKR